MSTLTQYGDWALVTGASAGIGREFARQLAAQGLNVAVVARREDRLRELADELTASHGVRVHTVPLDLTRDDAVEALREALGGITIGILVNNAGFGDLGPLSTREPGRIREMITLNCIAPALITRSFLPEFLERDRGAIITVASVLGLFPVPYEATYAATKAFDLSFGEALAHELKGTGVVSMVLCPSLTETEMLLAEGIDPDKARQIYKRADSAKKVVRIALKSLGRKRTCGPRDYHLFSWIIRLTHRSLPSRIAAFIMRRDFYSLNR